MRLLATVWLAATFTAAAMAQSYPQKPVRLVVPFAAGSATDIVARLLAQGLSERMKGTFVVEDRPGANGAIAADYVAKAAPDGYTIMMATTSSHSQTPLMMKGVTYDSIRDFTPIAGIGGVPFVIVVHPSLPVKNVRELIASPKRVPVSSRMEHRAARRRSAWKRSSSKQALISHRWRIRAALKR